MVTMGGLGAAAAWVNKPSPSKKNIVVKTKILVQKKTISWFWRRI